MIPFSQFLVEKTYELNKDVDYIYDLFFKDIIIAINKNQPWEKIDKLVSKTYGTSIQSNVLNDEDSKIADDKNPVTIKYGEGNNYNPSISGKAMISVCINRHAMKVIADFGDIENATSAVGSQSKAFRTEFSKSRIKGTIHHELAHWIDDSYTGRVRKMLMKNKREVVYQGFSNVALTDYEVQAQIHSIIQIKRMHKDVWNKITTKEMIELNASLTNIYDDLGRKERSTWLKFLLKRMAREGLVGSKMR